VAIWQMRAALSLDTINLIRNGGGALNTLLSLPLLHERWMGMRKIGLLISAVMAALVLTMTSGPLSQQGLSPQPAQARLPALTVTVACKATPETTRVKNNRGRAITIKTVGSIYQPYSYEPFRVDRRLGGGNSVTFESGSGANHNKLTGSYIYNNDVGSKEGARVVTKTGSRFVDHCG
jgi:hypothetical protein